LDGEGLGSDALGSDALGSESVEELRAAVVQLKQHTAELVNQLGLARQQLDRALELQAQSAALLSFEVRTQTTTIVGAAELLATELPGPLTEKQSRLVENAGTASMRLYGAISSLLEYNRLQAGEVTLELDSVDLETVCRQALEHIQRAAASKLQRVHFTCRRCEPHIVGDAQRLEKMIEQLLSFAVQRAPVGGCVTLEVTREETPEAAGHITLRVRDNGPEINNSDLARLFEPFDANGARLGLVLARELAGLHGGALRVESRPGHGSAFVLTLPDRR
jgi:signal transduction histidine kinase